MADDISKYSNYTADGLDKLLIYLKGKPNLEALLSVYLDKYQAIENLLYFYLEGQTSVDDADGVFLDAKGAKVGQDRNGMADALYRLYIKARILVNSSNGTANELIAIIRTLEDNAAAAIEYTEYYPKTALIRINNRALAEYEVYYGLLNAAKPAGTRLHLLYAPTESNDDNLFTFGDSTAPSTSATQGFNDFPGGPSDPTGGKLLGVFYSAADGPAAANPTIYFGLGF